MKRISYSGYRFAPQIIHQAIWIYFRFTLIFHDVDDLLAERGITVSYEAIRRWVNHFGPMIAADLRTPGKIVFYNRLMEVIQYDPGRVHLGGANISTIFNPMPTFR